MSYSPYLKRILINKYIGKEVYNSVHPETRNILIQDAMKSFSREMIEKYGSFYNYFKSWCNRNGFKNPYEYHCFWVENNTEFENPNKYRDSIAKKAGFKSRGDYQKHNAIKKGFKDLHDLHLSRLKERGFENQREYREMICKKYGLKTYTQVLKYNKLKKEGTLKYYVIQDERLKLCY